MLLALLLSGWTLLSGCATPPHNSRNPAPKPLSHVDAVIDESWISVPSPEDELDSLAVWAPPRGDLWVIATAKSTHRLVVLDGETGARLRTVGARGSALGQFERPNGIAVEGDLVFVVERDNHRVQVLRLPDFQPLAIIGADVLQLPYGVWLRPLAPGRLEMLVTDSFMADFRAGVVPPLPQLDQRVKRFLIDVDGDGAVHARLAGQFGDTTEQGALRMVESIAGDAANDRLLIAEEDRRVGSTLRDYTLQGRYRGFSLPVFDADAEGVALWQCQQQAGYWIAVDQVAPTLFRVFDRQTLAPAGVFSGRVTANTDGEVLHAAPSRRFPAGVVFALHDDRSVSAFDLGKVSAALHLGHGCV